METKVARLQLEDGRDLIFEEHVDLPAPGERLVSIDTLPNINFEMALATIKSATNKLVETFTSIDKRPDECDLEFGIKLSAAAGAILAKAGAEANFTVKMKWRATPAGAPPTTPAIAVAPKA